jgi:hypothetical protein
VATKLYFTNRTAPYTPPTLRGAWDLITGVPTRALTTHKRFDDTITSISQDQSVPPVGHDTLVYRGVSGPLAAQTIDGTIDLVMAVRGLFAGHDIVTHLHLYVTQGDSDTPRGTLLSDFIDTTGTEWPSTTAGISLSAPQTLSSLVVSDGDRLVLEIGSRVLGSDPTFTRSSFAYGSGFHGFDIPDLTVGSFAWDQEAGFITLSDDLVWSALTHGRLTQAIGEVMEDATIGNPPAYFTQVMGEAMEDEGDFPAIGYLTQVIGEVMMDNTPPPGATPQGLATVSIGGRRRRGRTVFAPMAVMPLAPVFIPPPIDPSWHQHPRPPKGWPRHTRVLEATILPLLPTPEGTYGKGPGWQYTIFGDTFIFSGTLGGAMIWNQEVDPKQPDEIKRYNGDWHVRLAPYPGLHIVASVWEIMSPDQVLTTSEPAIAVGGLYTSALFHGGTPGSNYNVKNTVTLSDGQIWHGYGLLRVDDEATLLDS